MKARHTLPLLAFAFLGPFAHADEAANKDAQTQIMAFYAKKDAAIKAGDYTSIKALAERCAVPAFTLVLPGKKKLTLPQMMAGMKTSMATGLPETAEKTTLVGMTVNGSHATTLAANHSAGPFIDKRGKFGSKGTRHQFSTTEHEKVQWVKQGDTWKVASVKILSETDTVDGKRVH